MRFVFAFVFVLFALPASAFHYQYKTDTLEIVGGNMDPAHKQVFPGVAYLFLTGEPSWPVPSGCSYGRLEWSAVNQHPNPTAVVLRSGLKVFKCRNVSSAAEVDAIVDEESKALCDSFPQPDPLVAQLKLDVDRVCAGDTADSGDCADARTAYTAVVTARARDAAADKAEAKRLTEAIQTLHTDAATFKSDQSW